MAYQNESISMLDMFMHPVFCVKDGIITKINQSARQYPIELGQNVHNLISAGRDEYENFSGVCLSVSLCIENRTHIASVFRSSEEDVFHLQSDYKDPDLRAISLAAQQLRGPLATAMISAERLSSQADESMQNQLGHINRSLFQLLRAVDNMSDASCYTALFGSSLENVNISSVIREIMDRVYNLADSANRKLIYNEPNTDIICRIDRSALERGIYNMLSNAIKHSPENSTIQASLSSNGSKFSFSTENQCPDLNTNQMSSLFARYLREPGIEEGRQGMGLGIKMIQSAAAVHNGSLLIDRPSNSNIRFTMTIPIQRSKNTTLRAPIQAILSSGYDNALLELSDVLPSSVFNNPF